MKAEDAVGDGGRDNGLHTPDTGDHHNDQQRDIYWYRTVRQSAAPSPPDAALPPGADVDNSGSCRPLPKEAGGVRRITIRFLPGPVPEPVKPDTISSPKPAPARVPEPQTSLPHPEPEIEKLPPKSDAQPREVEVRFLEAERAGRAFPCLQGHIYTGCIGFDRCKVLCWSPRLRERQALVRVDKPTGGPCRDCAYAREVLGEVATLNGRQVRLIECRLGFWYGRTTVSDFVDGKIALNVQLPCPGFIETDLPHPAVAHMRETARRRARRNQQKQEAVKAKRMKEHSTSK